MSTADVNAIVSSMANHTDVHSPSRSEGLKQFDEALWTCLGAEMTPDMARVIRDAAIHYGHACASEVLRDVHAATKRVFGEQRDV